MENYVNSFGFDIGIASVGSAVIADNKLNYLGVRIFEQASEAKDSRAFRSARRNTARKKWRKKQLRKAFMDFGLITKEKLDNEAFGCFTVKSEEFDCPKDRTVYHLRKRALEEQVTNRELYLCFLNMLHARGHFNMETIDFSKDTITFEKYKDLFYMVTEPYFTIYDSEKEEFENNILTSIFESTAGKTLINTVSKKSYVDAEQESALVETLKLLNGYKAKIRQISEHFPVEKDSVSISDLRDLEDSNEFFAGCLDLFDMARISKLLEEDDYLCQKAVKILDEYERIVTQFSKDSKEYKDYMVELAKNTKNKKHIRSWRNVINNYPNGLYVKEATAILKKQQEFNPAVTDAFIEAVTSILSARIPYFIGPLNTNGKNAWVVRSENKGFKYSYAYTQKYLKDQGVNEADSIEEWKKRMISRCTYLPDKYALPKGSFMAEAFSILNELNILKAFDKDGNQYYLTMDDKVKVFDTLFLKKKTVSYNDIEDVLDLESFGPKRKDKKRVNFNNSFTIYHQIAGIIPELAVSTIMELFDEPEKIEKLEDVILTLNLHDEERTKIDAFKEEYGLDTAKKLARLNVTGFYSFSKEFIFETFINTEGDTILSKLMKDNHKDETNEQMTIITNATDTEGNPVDYRSNKYEQKIRENNGELTIDLLIEDGKPVISMSRPVIRALNECMKIYSELVKYYGVPKRVVIETARDFKDHTEVGMVPERRFNAVQNLHGYLMEQIKAKKLYDGNKNIREWEDLAHYAAKNELKIELYIRQNGTDLLTGKKIDINNLNDYEIDHILPRGFGDNSKDDKMLVSRKANAKKADRLPLQFIESMDGGDEIVTTGEFMKRVDNLFENGLISEKKYKMLTLANDDELDGFINQNLVDTRYIIREFMAILRAYNHVHSYDTHIVALKSAYTALYRNTFSFDKIRDFGDQHHAYDAAMLLIADRTLSTMYPHYDERAHYESKNDSPFATYRDFVKTMHSAQIEGNEKQKKDLKYFIKNAYYKAFGESSDAPGSMISVIKATVPYYSVKVHKNYKGKYFEATILPHKDEKVVKQNEDAPLTIVGVNNDSRIFSGVECAAVDFYKITNKKGNKEHVAIHIPKVIIHDDGTIDKEMYLKLIREYYNKPELIDENGELKEYYFRFRAYRNDIIYDTVSNWPTLFNIGSMKRKKLDKVLFNVFSYDQIYKRGNTIQSILVKKFNIKTKQNKDGIQYKDLNTDVLVEYTTQTIWNHSIEKTTFVNISEAFRKCKNIYDLSNRLAYYELLTDHVEYPATVIGQYQPVVNPNYLKKSPDYNDSQYIKLKYNILGLRFVVNENGKLIITSPKELPGAFSKITKEEFSWKISKM